MPDYFFACWCDNNSVSDWELDNPSPVRGSRVADGRADKVDGTNGPKPPSSAPPGRAKGASKRRAWFFLSPAGTVLRVIGAFAGFYTARSYSSSETAELELSRRELSKLQQAHSHAEERNWDYYRTVEALRVENEALRLGLEGEDGAEVTLTSVTTAEVLVLGGPYGDGVYYVGEDIMPGTYDAVCSLRR